MKTIAVVNQKGGVGKSTISVSLTSGLALKGYKVLLIDTDPQGNATTFSGADNNKIDFYLHDYLIDGVDIKDIVIKTEFGYDVVPGDIRLNTAKLQLNTIAYREEKIKNLVKQLDYDFVIIDCHPDLDILTQNAIVAANFLLVPIKMELPSLKGLEDLKDIVLTMKQHDNKFNFKDYTRIVCNEINKSESIVNEQVELDLEEGGYEEIVLKTKLGKNTATKHAQYAMTPIHHYSPKNQKIISEYNNLISELLKLWQN